MVKKLTAQEFIEKAVEVHGDAYDYSASEYKTSRDTVKIFCIVHGEFFYQTPASHLFGRGCPKCGLLKIAKVRSKTREQFIADCIVVHGDLYDYKEVEYKNNHSKVRIKCNKHNSYFTQSPNGHLSGSGCPICGYEKVGACSTSSQERFLEFAALVHGARYIYDKTVYIRSNRKVIITCRVHSDYEQTPISHLSGRGCPNCAKTGYNPSKAGHLYLLQCADITKIGITNRTPNIRARDISRAFGARFSVKYSWEFEDGSVPDEIETVLIRELRSNYNSPVNRFEGSSECFFNVDYTLLLSRINQEIELRTQLQ